MFFFFETLSFFIAEPEGGNHQLAKRILYHIVEILNPVLCPLRTAIMAASVWVSHFRNVRRRYQTRFRLRTPLYAAFLAVTGSVWPGHLFFALFFKKMKNENKNRIYTTTYSPPPQQGRPYQPPAPQPLLHPPSILSSTSRSNTTLSQTKIFISRPMFG